MADRITDAAGVFKELDGIISDLLEGYPDLVDDNPAETYPASIRARVERLRSCLEIVLAE